ncbi:MAG: tetratricopeptide repeat protein [Alphaproteobacteria bacterium]|nr:tetratricopeptide repeat protein [Alphaproteobacteria bacterium]
MIQSATDLLQAGVARGRAGDHDGAAACFRTALAQEPRLVDARVNLAGALANLGAPEDALAVVEAGLELEPDEASLLELQGRLLELLGRAEVALAAWARCLRLKPGQSLARAGLLRLLAEPGRDPAERLFQALGLSGEDPVWLSRIGLLLHEIDLPGDAERCLRAALSLRPDYQAALHNLALLLRETGRAEEALPLAERALLLDPDDVACRLNHAFALLATGRWAEGFAAFEARRLASEGPLAQMRTEAGRDWQGEPLQGRTLLLQCEQGTGDTIQALRLIPAALSRAQGNVLLEVQPELLELVRESFRDQPALRVMPRAADWPGHAGLPPFDLQCPLQSLPLILGLETPQAIPGSVPWLRAPEGRRAAWAKWLATIGHQDALKVGIVWRGNPRYPDDHRRSPGARALSPLFAVDGVHWVGLQVPPHREELLQAMGARRLARASLPGARLADFADTASVIEGLDLVITSCTSVAHLAGALGRPAWVLLHAAGSWRWLEGRSDSPWYPSLRLYRQVRPGDWEELVRRVAGDLEALAAQRVPAAIQAARHRRLADELRRKGEFTAAREEAGRALAIAGGDQSARLLAGVLALDLGRDGEAEEHFRLLVRDAPKLAEAHVNLAVALRRLGRRAESARHAQMALDLAPDMAQSQAMMGLAALDRGRHEEAVRWLRRAVDTAPEDALVRFTLATSLLKLGRYREGWREYEWREQVVTKGRRHVPRLPGQRWRGEEIAGQRLLVFAEQGMGDAIQFMRFLPPVLQRAPQRIELALPAPLLALARASFARHPSIGVHAMDEAPADCPWQAPLLSLPGILGITLEKLPNRVPYLAVPQAAREKWRARLNELRRSARRLVGLNWAGNPEHPLEPLRSPGFDALRPLLGLAGCRFVSLQIGAEARALPEGLADLGGEIGDFADMAAIMEGLDLMVSSCTAPLHLAGALGRPAVAMLHEDADWRWLIRRTDSPWYPTMRLCRQPRAGDWASVVAAVGADLARGHLP